MANPKILWRSAKSGRIIVAENRKHLIVCTVCPCCRPRVIASAITNRSDGRESWDLRPYQGNGIGLPGARWRLRDVGENHHDDPGASCSGIIYNTGTVDANGKLTGLPDRFVSDYYYNGYMELQQGCVRPDGSVEWPCPNG